MLTRLRVKGFKNLVDAEVTFGPFTCIAGANAVGKSNFFDAIIFLKDLASLPIIEAAVRVRDPSSRGGEIVSLFSQSKLGSARRMEFDCDMIVPLQVVDDFGRQCQPSITYLNYKLAFSLDEDDEVAGPKLSLASEELTYIQKGDAASRLGFPHRPKFRNSIVVGRRTAPLISSEDEGLHVVVKLHQDGGSSGPAFRVPAKNSPRTILGGTNTNDQPTVLAARREMQSWMLLQLEPTALRRPDNFSADPHITPNGEHLPSTLARLGTDATVASELAELLPDVRSISVDIDEGRRLRTLTVQTRDGINYPARALSDGTLRFLALAVLRSDSEAGRLLCLEEPENGIHPSRISAILVLLQEMSADAEDVVDEDNALRQVIINTHSPIVVQSLPFDSLVLAKSYIANGSYQTVFEALEGTWRTSKDSAHQMQSASLGDLLGYLGDKISNYNPRRISMRGQSVLEFASRQGVLPFMHDKPRED